MKILVVGSGGREHAIIKKLRESEGVTDIICAPGNGGIADLAECVSVSATDIDGMVKLAKERNVDFAVVAPDDPLAMGMVDRLEEAGIPAFGPDAKAAQIEASKVFAKELMQRANIRTAAAEVFTDPDKAKAYIKKTGVPTVIKADGLAKGKGVIIAQTEKEAEDAVDDMLCGGMFGNAGSRIIVEEFLEGTEASIMCFCDGKTVVPMISSQDHKRQYDGDLGKNTGGMGAFAPTPAYTEEIARDVEENILQPTVKAMRDMGCPFKGVLYAGLMLTKKGAYVLEYNARFGDPETQVVLPMLRSDLLKIMQACREGTLSECDIAWEKGGCCVVVMTSGGYPDKYENGFEIKGLADAESEKTWVIHAGTKRDGEKMLTSGGRVLGVCAKGDTVLTAVKSAYEAVEKISFHNAFYRRDIGGKIH